MRKLIGVMLVGLLAGCVVTGQNDTTKEENGIVQQEVVKPITGQCHCGHITYEAQHPIVKCSNCDCRGCQKATGTLKAPFVTVQRTGFKITAGEPSRFRSDSGARCDCQGEWYFCPKCGTQVFWKADKGNEVDIFAGTLDDTTLFEPKE